MTKPASGGGWNALHALTTIALFVIGVYVRDTNTKITKIADRVDQVVKEEHEFEKRVLTELNAKADKADIPPPEVKEALKRIEERVDRHLQKFDGR